MICGSSRPLTLAEANARRRRLVSALRRLGSGGRPPPARRRLTATAIVLSLLAASGLACGVWPFSDRAERISLRAGAAYPRLLGGRGPYRFRFGAAAGVFLHLAVEQRGAEVAVLLRGPSRQLLFEVDSSSGSRGEETVLAVTPEAGDYLLVVEPVAAGPRGASGAFTLKVREVRAARREDRLRAAAAEAWTRAERRRRQGDLHRAAAAYREALPRLASVGEPGTLAAAEWRLGQALVETGEPRQGAAALERAVVRFRSLHDGVGEARAGNALGDAWRNLGETTKAFAGYNRSLELYRQAGNVSGTAMTLNNIGLVLETTGDLGGAIDRYESALAVWRRLGARSAEAATLQNLGSLYALIGHDAEALDLLERASGLLAGDRDQGKRIRALVALGWAQYLAGQPERALGRYREALDLAQRAGGRLDEEGIWDRRGSALRALHRYDEAAESYSRALEKSRAAGSRLSEGNTLANLGWLDLETGAVARGRERLTTASQLLAGGGDRNAEVYARVGLSRAERRLGAMAQARQQAAAAVRLVEQLRSALQGPASRGQFLATRFNAYEELVSVLMDLDRREPDKGHAREALEVAERARARSLLEEMTAGPEGPAGPAGPAVTSAETEDTHRHQSLLAEIQTLEERRKTLAEKDAGARELAAVDAELRARWLQLDRLTAPTGAPPPPAPVTAAQMQALADERSLLIVYLLAEPVSFAWTVDRQQVVAHALPGRDRIERLARRVLVGLSQGPATAAQATVSSAMSELSQAILAPLEQRIESRPNLVILADGALHLVPFAALPAPGGGAAGAAATTDEPLLVRHEVVMIPSATVLAWQRQRLAGRRPAPGVVAVLADPLLSPDDERLTGARLSRGAAGAAGGTGPQAGQPDRTGVEPRDVERLPFTAQEARAIVGLVPRGRALLALGAAASRDLVLGGGLRRYRYLHFATHGVLDPVLPERSGILLSQFDDQGRRRDGFLSAPAVAALDLPAELCVLSGCQTGLGRELRGEGLVGLTQAFFRAGARRLVVSLWNVRDRATAELMARFYRDLLAGGLPPAAALRDAQLALRSQPSWRSPYYWAGFSFAGDWR
jgi:CHAT domain-containing protein